MIEAERDWLVASTECPVVNFRNESELINLTASEPDSKIPLKLKYCSREKNRKNLISRSLGI